MPYLTLLSLLLACPAKDDGTSDETTQTSTATDTEEAGPTFEVEERWLSVGAGHLPEQESNDFCADTTASDWPGMTTTDGDPMPFCWTNITFCAQWLSFRSSGELHWYVQISVLDCEGDEPVSGHVLYDDYGDWTFASRTGSLDIYTVNETTWTAEQLGTESAKFNADGTEFVVSRNEESWEPDIE